MAQNEISNSGGIGFPSALFLLFLGLKLGGVIDWSWWWVTAPLWVPVLIVFTTMSFFFLLFKKMNG